MTLSTSFTFPHLELMAITEWPTISTTNCLHKELYDNAMSVKTTAGSGKNGHLGLVMDPASYQAHAAKLFIKPAHPSPLPDHQGLTKKQIIAANCLYDVQMAEYKMCKLLKVELHKQIIAAIPKLYLPPDDPLFGYNKITPAQMLQHLITPCGQMTPDELKANEKCLEQEFNVDDRIESLWHHISEIQTLATSAGEPIPNSTVMHCTLQVMDNTGLYMQGCCDWHKCPSAEHTLDNFIAHFNKEDVKHCHQLTVQQVRFHRANHTTSIVNPQANNTSSNNTPDAQCEGFKLYYCWTHGLSCNQAHTSKTCKTPAEGHKKEATYKDMMGGSCMILLPKFQHNNQAQSTTQANELWSGDPKLQGTSSLNGNCITNDFTINSMSHLLGVPTNLSSTNYIETCADTGATGHFFTTMLPISNLCPATHPITIRNPNGSIMHSTHEAKLNLPQLPLLA